MSLLHSGSTGSGTGSETLYPEDVFSTYLYTGNGSTQTINNGIDLAGNGGMVWVKNRLTTATHNLYDTARGVGNYLLSNLTDAQASSTAGTRLTAFNSSGFSLGTDPGSLINAVDNSYVSWTFRKASKFFEQQTKVHTNGTASIIDLSALGEVGMVTVKATSTTSSWYTWHRSLTAGNNLKLNFTNAQSSTNAFLSVSGTTLTIASTTPSATYVVYAWAHDPSAEGIIQCGSFTTDASGNATVSLGWEPQYLLTKASLTADNWEITDTIRGWTNPANNQVLRSNLSNAEISAVVTNGSPTALGFIATRSVSQTYIYLAIRRPNKVPTSGTEVYNAVARTGTGAATSVSTTITPDLCVGKCRSNTPYSHVFMDRLRGAYHLLSSTTDVEASSGASYYSKLTNNTVTVGTATELNENTYTYINHFFKRAKGFMDIVCYTGTGVVRTVPHGLGVVPELIIVKSRSADNSWYVWFNFTSTTYKQMYLNFTYADGGDVVYSTIVPSMPTSSVFSLGTNSATNGNGNNHVSYLFATLAGVSKVGSYTGNGTSQTIPCGFSTGARFVLSKAVSTTGNWNIGDSTRGITSGTDPLLCLNTTAAEVTTDDWLDPESSGFIVNETASAHANTNGVQYVFLAIS